MPRRFVVHVGAPKTGTSAFQEWAVANRSALLESGYLYPVVGATGGGNHAALVSALGGAIEDDARTGHLIRLFERELASNPAANVILSAELMTTLRFLPNMKRLRRAIAKYTDDATVILVVRDQIAWRNSCYAQSREMMSPLPRFRDYVSIGKNGPRGGNWEYLEERYRAADFDFETLAFDRRVREIGIVAALASLSSLDGLASLSLGERREANPSVGDLALLVAEQVRLTIAGPGGELPPGLRAKLVPIVARHSSRLPKSTFNGFDQSLADQVRKAYSDSNDRFARRHFSCNWQELFPSTPLDHVSPDDISELQPAERRRIRAAAGRIIVDAVEAGILRISPA